MDEIFIFDQLCYVNRHLSTNTPVRFLQLVERTLVSVENKVHELHERNEIQMIPEITELLGNICSMLYDTTQNEDAFFNALEISVRIRKYYLFPHLEVPHVYLYIYT